MQGLSLSQLNNYNIYRTNETYSESLGDKREPTGVQSRLDDRFVPSHRRIRERTRCFFCFVFKLIYLLSIAQLSMISFFFHSAFAFCITAAFVPFPFNDVVLNVHITIRQHFNVSFAQNLKIFNELHSKYQTKRNNNTAN